jgi:2-methylcitrate dehydratase PrpD
MEVETKIAEASGPRSYRSGFHSTGVFGVFGAAAGAAKLRGLTVEQIQYALGIAGAHSSGLIENIGSMTKPFQAGHSAEGGVVAADLAAIGWTATKNVLEGRRGFYTAHAGEFDENVLFDTLGGPWTLAFPGVSIKPYPSGSQLHAAMDSMLQLVLKHDITPQNVARVRVGGKQALLNTLTHYRPQNGTEAKFSMQFSIASLLLDRRAGLLEHEDDLVRRPELQALFPKIELYRHPDADAAGDDKLRSYVEVTLNDGTVLNGEPLDYARGSPLYPMSFDDVAEKVLGCADFARFPAGKTKLIIDAVRNIDKIADVRDLTKLFN